MRYRRKTGSSLKRWWEQLQYGLIAHVFKRFFAAAAIEVSESFRFAGELADRGYSVVISRKEGARKRRNVAISGVE